MITTIRVLTAPITIIRIIKTVSNPPVINDNTNNKHNNNDNNYNTSNDQKITTKDNTDR